MPKILCACGRTVDTKPEWGGQWIACPGCSGTLYAPYPGDKPSPPVPIIDVVASQPAPAPTPVLPVSAAAGPTRLCPWCAEAIPLAAAPCPFCKGNPNERPASPPARPMPPATMTTTADGGWAPLIIGLVGMMMCPLIAPVAWAMGSTYEKNCRAQGLKPAGAGTAGKILGIVGCVYLGLIALYLILAVVAGA